MHILCVCLGNICRSPAAEGVLRRLLPDATFDSAGTSDWHLGEAPYPPMQDAARARGIDLSSLRSRQVGVADFDRFDLILAMDSRNLRGLEALRPEGARADLRLFTDFAPDCGVTDIPDPWYTRDFDGALDLIETCARGLAAHLLTPPKYG